MNFDGRRFPFAACGEDVTIFEWVRLLGAERTTVGSHIVIDDFVFFDGRGGATIGDHVHIAGFVSVAGAGEVVLGDFVGLAAGTRLVTGTDRFDGSGLTGPTVPARWRSVERGFVRIGRHAVLGTNVVVHPNVTIGEGAIVGSGSVVTRDLPPWQICVGTPARPVKERPRETILGFERELREEQAADDGTPG